MPYMSPATVTLLHIRRSSVIKDIKLVNLCNRVRPRNSKMHPPAALACAIHHAASGAVPLMCSNVEPSNRSNVTTPFASNRLYTNSRLRRLSSGPIITFVKSRPHVSSVAANAPNAGPPQQRGWMKTRALTAHAMQATPPRRVSPQRPYRGQRTTRLRLACFVCRLIIHLSDHAPKYSGIRLEPARFQVNQCVVYQRERSLKLPGSNTGPYRLEQRYWP